MIKLSIEIKNEEFLYTYDVAGCTQSGTCPLTPEGLKIFTECLYMVQRSYINRSEEFMREVTAKAYIEQHPELLEQAK